MGGPVDNVCTILPVAEPLVVILPTRGAGTARTDGGRDVAVFDVQRVDGVCVGRELHEHGESARRSLTCREVGWIANRCVQLYAIVHHHGDATHDVCAVCCRPRLPPAAWPRRLRPRRRCDHSEGAQHDHEDSADQSPTNAHLNTSVSISLPELSFPAQQSTVWLSRLDSSWRADELTAIQQKQMRWSSYGQARKTLSPVGTTYANTNESAESRRMVTNSASGVKRE